jgi:hypothetical protein
MGRWDKFENPADYLTSFPKNKGGGGRRKKPPARMKTEQEFGI